MAGYCAYFCHHAGAGGSAARVLHGIMVKSIQGRVFYDIDNLGHMGWIIDAVRVSKNMIVAFGSETLCRPWCLGALVCGNRMGIPMHNVTSRVCMVICSKCPVGG